MRPARKKPAKPTSGRQKTNAHSIAGTATQPITPSEAYRAARNMRGKVQFSLSPEHLKDDR